MNNSDLNATVHFDPKDQAEALIRYCFLTANLEVYVVSGSHGSDSCAYINNNGQYWTAKNEFLVNVLNSARSCTLSGFSRDGNHVTESCREVFESIENEFIRTCVVRRIAFNSVHVDDKRLCIISKKDPKEWFVYCANRSHRSIENNVKVFAFNGVFANGDYHYVFEGTPGDQRMKIGPHAVDLSTLHDEDAKFNRTLLGIDNSVLHSVLDFNEQCLATLQHIQNTFDC